MIAPGHVTESEPNETVPTPEWIAIARYGRVPQVARFGGEGIKPERDSLIRVTTDRGEELASVLGLTGVSTADSEALTGQVQRIATQRDLEDFDTLESESETEFAVWEKRVHDWKMQLQLIDIERTLDRRLILYVLNERGPETTRLALLAAAGGHGIIHVQPVTSEGIPNEKAKGGCGDCGCSTH
ncbi:MAG: hypothetical protein JNM43_14650 [Planctomycetaceae bacterium]|nr:hypothetical protein [Planctomycetaceae bacterium]